MWEWFLALTALEQTGVAGTAVTILAYFGIGPKNVAKLSRKIRGKAEPIPIVRLAQDEPEPETESSPPAKHFINVPTGRPVIGRDEELKDLATKLEASGEVQVTNSGAILAGQGGIGKTTLARAFAERNAQDYAGVLWVNAVTRQSVIDGLMNFCGPLGLEVPNPAQEAHAQAVLAKLAETGQRWLIIYDNVEQRDDIRGLIPRGSHLIATTRQGEGWPGFDVQNTDVLGFDGPDSAAVRLLMAEAERSEDATGAQKLAKKLGGLPLALVMAGGMLRKNKADSFSDYLGRVSEIIAKEPKNSDYPDSVIGAVRLSYDQLSDDAKLVADLFAWWAPEGLEARLITDAVEGRWEFNRQDMSEAVQSLAQSPGRVNAAIEALEDRSILRRGDTGFELHRMSAAALRAMQGAASVNNSATALLAAVYPGGTNNPAHSENWPECRRLTPHLRSLWDNGDAPKIAAMEFLLNQASVFLDKIGDVEGDIIMARASLELIQERLPEDHRDIAVGHANLGLSLRRLLELAGAEAELRRAVALDEAHRPDSVEMAEHYDLLGGVLLDKGRAGDRTALVEALRMYQKSAAILRRHAPRQSDAWARVLNNLGAVRDALGQGAAALRLYEYSLAINRKVLPEGDARLGYGVMNTGALALKSGAADRAEPLLEEALALRQAVYVEAPKHPEIVDTADWLTSCYLVRAREGENRGMREMKARQLCEAFGFDFDREVEHAKQFPYTAT